MSEQDQHSKTEAPTPRRREKARQEGEVAYSNELVVGASMLAASLTFWLVGPSAGQTVIETLRTQLRFIPFGEWTSQTTTVLSSDVFDAILATLGTLVGVLFVTSLLVGGSQTGFRITLKPLSPNWDRLNPVQGWSRLFSLQSAMRGLLATAKSAALVAIVLWILRKQLVAIHNSGRGSLISAVSLGWDTVVRMMFSVAFALVAAGGLDYIFQRWRLENKLRMSRQDLKDERKDEEGDPQVRAKIKQLRAELAKTRMFQDVPKATVVLTNPTHIAVALKYDRSEAGAPIVVAKGSGALANRIRKIAEENDVPVLERKPIARMLFKSTAVGEEIPVELYHAIAEIVAYLYRLGRVA